MDFEHSERARTYLAEVSRFMKAKVIPAEATYLEQLVRTEDWTKWRIPPVMEELKAEAKALGLWNLFMPDPKYGAGLDNRDYAPIAELTGRSFIAPEVFNCNAPDTGNAEVLVQYGSEEQQERWLKPLLAGEIRAGFSMTEPAVASSDATNMKATCEVVGDEVYFTVHLPPAMPGLAPEGLVYVASSQVPTDELDLPRPRDLGLGTSRDKHFAIPMQYRYHHNVCVVTRYAHDAIASAPPVISASSWVIAAWRAVLKASVRSPMSSVALSVAFFIAIIRMLCSDAMLSSIA